MNQNKNHKSEFVQYLFWVIKFIKASKANVFFLLIPMGLTFIASLLDGLGIGLLIPLFKGIIEKDFDFIRKIKVFKHIFEKFPEFFSTPNSSIFIFLIAIIFLSSLLRLILTYVASLSQLYFNLKIQNKIKYLIFNRYMVFGKLFFDNHNIGYLQSLLGRGVTVANIIKLYMNCFNKIVEFSVYLALMIFISFKLTIITLALFPLFYLSTKWLIKKIKSTSIFSVNAQRKINEAVYNILNCIFLVKAYAAEKYEGNRYRDRCDEVLRWRINLSKKKLLIGPIQEMVTLTNVLILVGFMSFLVMRDKSVDATSLLVFFYLLRKTQPYFKIFNNFKSQLASSAGQIEEINFIFDDKEKYITKNGTKEFQRLQEGIEVKNLSFSYKKNIPVLNDINFVVPKSNMIAIVGPTGSGKSTIINLFFRFYDPPDKTIFIDGVDLKEYDIFTLRKKIAFISQDTQLFNGTVKENLIYCAGRSVSDDEIESIIEKVYLSDYIAKMPDGIDTVIGDRGVRLSGGEKQRLSIARALIKKAEIMIMDEATSALDSITENKIQLAINEATKNITSIVIAHRLSTIKHADKIIVLEKKTIVESGTIDELLKLKGRFYYYWTAQKFD